MVLEVLRLVDAGVVLLGRAVGGLARVARLGLLGLLVLGERVDLRGELVRLGFAPRLVGGGAARELGLLGGQLGPRAGELGLRGVAGLRAVGGLLLELGRRLPERVGLRLGGGRGVRLREPAVRRES